MHWGSVSGDVNADAIISDRKPGQKWASRWATGSGFAFLAAIFWFAAEGGNEALSALIAMAAIWVSLSVGAQLHDIRTFIMIAERRTQLLEQALQDRSRGDFR